MNEEALDMVRKLFFEADRYAKLVVEDLALEPEKVTPVDEDIARDAFEYRGFCRLWEWTPRMAMELRRDEHVIHFLFPTLSDKERSLLLELQQACNMVKVCRRKAADTDLPKFDRESAAAKVDECLEKVAKCQSAIEEAKIEANLTATQMLLFETDYFDPDSKLVSCQT